MENRTPKPFLNFDDAGASDEEPAKCITAGDIRAWHDQYDNMLTTWAECRQLLSEERTAAMAARGQITAIVVTAGGTVEGYPTSEINVLQRIRKLVAIEAGLIVCLDMLREACSPYVPSSGRDREWLQRRDRVVRNADDALATLPLSSNNRGTE